MNGVTAGGQQQTRKSLYRKVMVGGKQHTHDGECVQFDEISHAGWIRITSVGCENLYFEFKDETGDLLHGWCKCL